MSSIKKRTVLNLCSSFHLRKLRKKIRQIKPKVSIGINLEDIAGSAPDHYNKVNSAIKRVIGFCVFLRSTKQLFTTLR